jgi:hypothetical protein
LIFILFKLNKVTVVQNSKTVAEQLLNIVQEAKSHQLKKVVFLKILFHILDSLLFEALNFKVVEYFPYVENRAARTFKNSSVKAFHGLLEIDLLNIRESTLKSY